jgi:hypothetical protein
VQVPSEQAKPAGQAKHPQSQSACVELVRCELPNHHLVVEIADMDVSDLFEKRKKGNE